MASGCIIPKEYVDALRDKGIGRLFSPGTPNSELIAYFRVWFATREKQES